MVKIYSITFFKSTGLFTYSLVLFLWALAACHSYNARQIALIFTNDRATGLIIPQSLLEDTGPYPLTVSLNGNEQAVLGSFKNTGEAVIFEPLVPLSPGMEYGVLQNNRVVGKISVPISPAHAAPKIVAVYPQADTVPENLLKLYVHFSEPMQTGNALEHIYLLDKNRDTLDRIFLNLQPELWDTTGTVLTLWIDPGRIKRDLLLNKSLGNPLHERQTYELLIKPDWKDRRGQTLTTSYSKKFIAAGHDGIKPDIAKWNLQTPGAGSMQPLTIHTNEPLDHYLLLESIRIIGPDGELVNGDVSVEDKDRVWRFVPDANWKKGNYRLRVDARLEDLAGNNLNKIFDRDIRKEKKKDNAYYERTFILK